MGIPMLRPIKVEIPHSVARQFRELAKARFPVESFAVLLGRSAGTLVEIEELWVPDDLDENTTPFQVSIPPDWWREAQKTAKEQGLDVVGDIHSHCYECRELNGIWPQPVPSEADLDGGQYHITGICQVTENSKKARRARIRFWGPQIEVKELYVTRR